ncbi:MAG: hypothetical protein QXT26_01185 [Thermoproteota archaeon]
MAEDHGDLKAIAKSYSELRLQIIMGLRRMNEYSKILFKAFLEYVEKRRRENLELHILLNDFLNELALSKDDRGTRISLARRFYMLIEKHFRTTCQQTSLVQYLENH